jgi:hypothetical protein
MFALEYDWLIVHGGLQVGSREQLRSQVDGYGEDKRGIRGCR